MAMIVAASVVLFGCGGGADSGTEPGTRPDPPQGPGNFRPGPPTPGEQGASTPEPPPSQTLDECLDASGYAGALAAASDVTRKFESDIEGAQREDDPYEQLAIITVAVLGAGDSITSVGERLERSSTCGDTRLASMTEDLIDLGDEASDLMGDFDVMDDDAFEPMLDAYSDWQDEVDSIESYVRINGSDEATEPQAAREVDLNSTDFIDVNDFAAFLENLGIECPNTTMPNPSRRDCTSSMVIALYTSPEAARDTALDQLASVCELVPTSTRIWVGNGVMTVPEADLLPYLAILRDFGADGKSCREL